MGLFAIGSSALGMSLGVDVKVLKEAPGPHSIIAWKPGAGSTACGIVVTGTCVRSGWWMGRDGFEERELRKLGMSVEEGEGVKREAQIMSCRYAVVACPKSHPAEI
jgi:hypothetical protein